jgi:hypothetical protein
MLLPLEADLMIAVGYTMLMRMLSPLCNIDIKE